MKKEGIISQNHLLRTGGKRLGVINVTYQQLNCIQTRLTEFTQNRKPTYKIRYKSTRCWYWRKTERLRFSMQFYIDI